MLSLGLLTSSLLCCTRGFLLCRLWKESVIFTCSSFSALILTKFWQLGKLIILNYVPYSTLAVLFLLLCLLCRIPYNPLFRDFFLCTCYYQIMFYYANFFLTDFTYDMHYTKQDYNIIYYCVMFYTIWLKVIFVLEGVGNDSWTMKGNTTIQLAFQHHGEWQSRQLSNTVDGTAISCDHSTNHPTIHVICTFDHSNPLE